MARKPATARRPAKAARPKFRKHQQADDAVKPHSRPKLLTRPPKLTVRQLLASIWPGDKERSQDIAVKKITKQDAPPSLPGFVAYQVTTYNRENKHNHFVTLIFDKAPAPSARVIVDDDTPRHTYFYEYALARRGNSFIYRSNGQAPVRTNPRNKPGISKHTYVALRAVLVKARGG